MGYPSIKDRAPDSIKRNQNPEELKTFSAFIRYLDHRFIVPDETRTKAHISEYDPLIEQYRTIYLQLREAESNQPFGNPALRDQQGIVHIDNGGHP
jgi:hypothetical protein